MVVVKYPMTRMSNPLASIEDNQIESTPLDTPFVGMVVILSDDGHDF